MSAINGSCLPCCHRTTKVVQLLNCNLFWAEFPPKQAGKMLALQCLLVGDGVTQQAAAVAEGNPTAKEAAPQGEEGKEKKNKQEDYSLELELLLGWVSSATVIAEALQDKK